MGCSSCATGGCSTSGCGDSGHCASGGCNRMNTFDWLMHMELPEADQIDIVEITFKNGVRKEFFRKPHFIDAITGDMVAVESTGGGYDIGRISLSGELVRLQMKKRRVKANAVLPNVLRKANERDLERMQEARDSEKETMIKARAIAAQLRLDMKVGEVEIQGDKRKATFYYTAEGRVDFRELIRIYAREFKVKIEMRQIGARQESAIIGGLGPCGRELCCSTWLTDFKSVSTGAARYQNLAINQSKLSGQCGRLKCCLNYELNTYLDALKEFPKNVENIETLKGSAFLLKTDIFKRIMFFAYRKEYGALDVYPLSIERVKAIAALNKQGKKPDDLLEEGVEKSNRGKREKGGTDEFVDGAGSLELSQLDDKKRRNKKRRNNETKPGIQEIQKQVQRGPKPEIKNTERTEEKKENSENRQGEGQPKGAGQKPRPKHKKPHHQNKEAGEKTENVEPKDGKEGQANQHRKPKHHNKNKKFNPNRKEGGQNPNNEKKDNQ
jgi:cell fate regulator YaaT (PSP1 superfamily)